MSVIEKVCPRCGSAAGVGNKFCDSCGLDLAAQFELPTKEEWLARHPEAHQPSDGSPLGSEPPARVAAAAPQPGGTAIQYARAGPEKLLGAGGLTISGSSVLYAIGTVLALVAVLTNHVLAGISVAVGFALLFALLLIAGFGIIGSGFLGRPDARPRLLQIGLGLTAGALFAQFVADSILTGMGAAHHAGGTAIAALVLVALGYLTATGSAIVASIGFGTQLAGLPWKRNSRLGSASIVLAAAALLAGVGNVIGTAASSDLGASGTVTAGAGVDAGGFLILMSAAVVAAVAFLLSSNRQRRGEARWRGRDVLLAVAMMVAALAFLLIMIAEMLSASSIASAGADGKIVAANWLEAVQYSGWVAAGICAALWFFLSSRQTQA